MTFNPISILVTLIVLTIIVAIHEFGHFSAAKFFKMEVKEFSIGFGKVLFKKFYKGTNYTFRLFPLGGFVELEGELDSSNPNNFRNRPYYQKVVVLSAGVIMNMVLAVVLLTGYLAITDYKFPIAKLTDYSFTNVQSQSVYAPVTITSISEDSPVKGIFKIGDSIVQINGKSFDSYNEFFQNLESLQGKEATFTLINLDTYETSNIDFTVPIKSDNGGILQVTLYPSNQPTYFLKYKSDILSGVSMTYDIFVYQIKALGNIFSNAFSSGNYQEVSNSVGGIVQVAGTVNSAVALNEYSFLVALTAFISISLAFFNILPIPALDGGHILIITIEKLTKRKLSDRVINFITTAGFGFMIILFVLVTFKDVLQLVLPK